MMQDRYEWQKPTITEIAISDTQSGFYNTEKEDPHYQFYGPSNVTPDPSMLSS